VSEAVGPEPQTDFSIRENAICEMQDVLSRYLPRFHSTAYRQLGNAADAEDAVQDALLAGYKHLDQFKGQAQMSTWLTSIVVNCARMQLRRRPRRPHVSLDEPLGKIRNIACQIVWQIPDQVLKTSVGTPNFEEIFCNLWRSCHPRCAGHSSCVT